MKIEIFKGNWTINDVKNNPDKIFVFGDNNARIGKGGQAIIRDLPNTIGIRTKKGPSTKPAAYYKDSEFEQNAKNILEDILELKKEAMDGMTIVFSDGGYGTGLADLEKKSPETFNFLCFQLREHFNFNNKTGKMWYKVPGYDEITLGTYIDFDKDTSIVKPVNNSYFRGEFLERSITTTYDLIKTGNKIAFTSDKSYKNGDVLIFTFNGKKDYLVCVVVDSYDVSLVLHDYQWYSFEGYDKSFNISGPEISSKYQTHFQFICILGVDGKMTFKDDIFSDKKKDFFPFEPTIDEKELIKLDNVKTAVVNKVEEVEEIEEVKKEDYSMGSVSNEELLEVLKRIESKLDRKFKNPFRKKTLDELLGKKFGSFSELKRIELSDKYQVKVDDIYYYVIFDEGVFRNSISVLLKSDKPMF